MECAALFSPLVIQSRETSSGYGFGERRVRPLCHLLIRQQTWQAVVGDNPVIAVGGPSTNRLTAELYQWKSNPPSKEGTYPIPVSGARIGTGFFRKNQKGLPQVALWGDNANAVRETVEYYFRNEKGLTEFLKICWK
jgi:hypothetical protein